MTSRFSSMVILTTICASAALTGCAADSAARHKQHHPAAACSQPPGALCGGPGPANEQREMDMNAMCRMHRDMMGARTPEERRTMMEQRMKGMSPDMMRQHMAMMHEKCK